MKQCPQCQEQFDDRQAFCDQDGTALVDPTDMIRAALNHAQVRRPSNVWITGTIGGFVGVIICILLYAVFLAGSSGEEANGSTSATQTQEQTPSRSTQVAAAPAPQNTREPEEDPSPEEEASPSPDSAEAANVPAPTAPPLNTGPIATGTRESREDERAIIKMKDGSSVEADAAWEDSQGIWYRRSGLVSFVERSRVEAITDPQQRQAAKAETKTP